MNRLLKLLSENRNGTHLQFIVGKRPNGEYEIHVFAKNEQISMRFPKARDMQSDIEIAYAHDISLEACEDKAIEMIQKSNILQS